MKALLLRVGIDKGYGSCLAPIFADGSFEYIPIPEKRYTSENRAYSDLPGRNCASLAEFVPAKLRDSFPHMDPEFETFTYGDPTRNKRRQLARLVPGDLLIFYAGLEPTDGIDRPRLFIIGYFTVKNVYDFGEMPETQHNSMLQRVRNNAHAKRDTMDKGLVVVEGDPQESKLLPKAIPLGDSRNYAMPDLAHILRYSGSILRSIGHWVGEEDLHQIKDWLNIGVPVLVEEHTHLFSYVLDSDTGYAPNTTGGYCTLACCKPKVRGTARVGDWVIGTMPKRFGVDKLAYVMRVNEVLSFDKYFNDARFESKKPDDDHPHGDNIYYKVEGKFTQLESSHHTEETSEHDTQSDSMLIGSLFWYFGGSGPKIPSRFVPELIKSGPGHKRVRDTDIIRDFASWVSSEYRPGILGVPRDGHTRSNYRKPTCSGRVCTITARRVRSG